MNDTDYVKIKYIHPNRGQHGVTGTITSQFYGYRGGGEVFLVHRNDQSAQPQWFQIVQERPLAPESVARVTAPPRPLVAAEEAPPEPILAVEQEAILKDVRLDLQSLPGVTPRVAKSLADAGFNTVDAILEAGVKGLKEIKFVGPAKAALIYKTVSDKNA